MAAAGSITSGRFCFITQGKNVPVDVEVISPAHRSGNVTGPCRWWWRAAGADHAAGRQRANCYYAVAQASGPKRRGSSQRSGGSGVLSCANELARGSCKFSLIGLKSLRSGFKYTAAALAPIAR